MKNFYMLASFLLIVCYGQAGYAQHAKELADGYYVVVAVFSPEHEDYAIRYSDGLVKKSISAAYGFNSERNYWYVYVKHFPDRKPSIEEMQQMRKQTGFEKTWVKKVSPVKSTLTDTVAPQPVLPEIEKPEEKIVEQQPVIADPVADTTTHPITYEKPQVNLDS
jgi:hypothetical protein